MSCLGRGFADDLGHVTDQARQVVQMDVAEQQIPILFDIYALVFFCLTPVTMAENPSGTPPCMLSNFGRTTNSRHWLLRSESNGGSCGSVL